LSSREKELKGKETTLSERNNEQKQQSWTSGQPKMIPMSRVKTKKQNKIQQQSTSTDEKRKRTTNNEQSTNSSELHTSSDVIFSRALFYQALKCRRPYVPPGSWW